MTGRPKYGVRVHNPLTLPVRVELYQNGTGVVGSAVIKPKARVYIPLDHPGDYEVRTVIISLDAQGNQEELGDGSWRRTGHQDVAQESAQAKEPTRGGDGITEEPPLRSLRDVFEDLKKQEVA